MSLKALPPYQPPDGKAHTEELTELAGDAAKAGDSQRMLYCLIHCAFIGMLSEGVPMERATALCRGLWGHDFQPPGRAA